MEVFTFLVHVSVVLVSSISSKHSPLNVLPNIYFIKKWNRKYQKNGKRDDDGLHVLDQHYDLILKNKRPRSMDFCVH